MEPAGGARASRCKWARSLLVKWGGKEEKGRERKTGDTEMKRQRRGATGTGGKRQRYGETIRETEKIAAEI